jgi:hypothetical protein
MGRGAVLLVTAGVILGVTVVVVALLATPFPAASGSAQYALCVAWFTLGPVLLGATGSLIIRMNVRTRRALSMSGVARVAPALV